MRSMVLTMVQFSALFVLSCLSGAFVALFCSLGMGVWGGIKPLTTRLNSLESEVEGLNGRFSRHQKSVAGVKSAEVRNLRIPKEFQALPPMEPVEDESMEFVG